jgi:endoglucanase
MRFVTTALLLTLITLSVSACASGHSTPHGANPIAGQSFYVEPHDVAAQQVSEWREHAMVAQATVLERVAQQPVASWYTGQGDVKQLLLGYEAKAAAAGRSALLVAYNIPNRDCGAFSGGGASSSAEYRQWIEQFAAGIGHAKTTVIVEPDAVAQTLSSCLPASVGAQRYELLGHAVAALRHRPNTTVYLDAGNPGWVSNLHDLAHALRRSGIADTQGFALNVSNFYKVSTVLAYGRRLSALLGGKHFVIDTSRDGNGPDTSKADAPDWCNPPGRALGPNPTTHTGISLVDAFLWVKQPGSSDGSCRSGEPRAGQWWPNYALELAANAAG